MGGCGVDGSGGRCHFGGLRTRLAKIFLSRSDLLVGCSSVGHERGSEGLGEGLVRLSLRGHRWFWVQAGALWARLLRGLFDI